MDVKIALLSILVSALATLLSASTHVDALSIIDEDDHDDDCHSDEDEFQKGNNDEEWRG